MPTDNEQQWLDAFVSEGDEGAFEKLVGLHIDLVLGCAFRMGRDRGLAEEVSQNVFTILARKASKLKAGNGLAGWLHKTTLYETKKALRGRSRQQRKMKALAKHSETEDNNHGAEDQILPLVDEAIGELPDGDREVLLQHYLEGRSYAEISRQIGKSEGACQKQASRTLEKLRAILGRRGATASATAIGSVLMAPSTKAASAGLVSAISGGAVTGAASVTTPALITNAIHTMTYAKTKVAILVAATAAVPIGAQMKANNDLREELSAFQQREAQYVAQAERLVQLEQQVAALPLQRRQGPGTSGSGIRVYDVAQTGRPNPNALPSAIAAGGGGAPTGRDAKRTAVSDTGAEGLGDLAPAGADLEPLLENPAMRHQMKLQAEAHIEATYGALFDYLELEEDIERSVRKELVDEYLSDSPSETEALMAHYAEHEARLRELLGEENFEVFERYDNSSTEREELAIYREALEEEGIELPIETERQLMAIMFDENNNIAALAAAIASTDESKPGGEPATTGEGPLGDAARPTLSASESVLLAEAERLEQGIVTPAAAAAAIETQREIQARIRARAAGILTPEQLAIFEGNQDNHLDLLRAGLTEVANDTLEAGER